MKRMTDILWIGLGGFMGANARFLISGWAAERFGLHFPWGTFIINISGSFALGMLATIIDLKLLPFHDHLRLGLAVGFLGAYTTFSTYELESHMLLEGGKWTTAVINLMGSLAAGLVAVRLGIQVVKWWT